MYTYYCYIYIRRSTPTSRGTRAWSSAGRRGYPRGRNPSRGRAGSTRCGTACPSGRGRPRGSRPGATSRTRRTGGCRSSTAPTPCGSPGGPPPTTRCPSARSSATTSTASRRAWQASPRDRSGASLGRRQARVLPRPVRARLPMGSSKCEQADFPNWTGKRSSKALRASLGASLGRRQARVLPRPARSRGRGRRAEPRAANIYIYIYIYIYILINQCMRTN